MDETPILVEKREGFRVITLNRPARLNAFTEDMHVALKAALDDIEADSNCRALLITGAGRGFCAGQDLNDRLAKPGEKIVLGGTLENYYNPLVRRLRALPFPVVAAVNGVAAGAGANVALACDIVLAAKSATLRAGFRENRPCSGFRRHLDLAAAGRRGPRTRPVTARRAVIRRERRKQWGLIWKAVGDNELMAEATKLCEQFASGPTYGLSLIKRALDASELNDLSTQLDLERDLQREAGSSPDYAEGVRAFMEKRAPKFTGKKGSDHGRRSPCPRLRRCDVERRCRDAVARHEPGFGRAGASRHHHDGDRRMVNGHKICHGGYIFTLADSAFAFSCNTYNQRTVAQHCAVTFLSSAKLGDKLVARAVERQRSGRSGIYDVTVTREEGNVIAEFRGHSRTIEGELLPARCTLRKREANMVDRNLQTLWPGADRDRLARRDRRTADTAAEMVAAARL